MEEQMAQNARVRAAAGPRAAAGHHDEAATAPIDHALEWLWHLLTSMRFVLVVLLAMAALGLVGTLVIQAPPGVFDDARTRSDWVSQVRPKYGAWTDALVTLQFFTVFSSVWFKAALAALSVSLVACSAHRVNGLWRTAVRPAVSPGDRFFEHAPQRDLVLTANKPAEDLDRIRTVLRAHHYRSVLHEDGDLHVYADRNRWAPMGSLVGHLSLIVILAGAIVGGALGFRNDSFVVAEGSTAAVATAGLSMELISFKDSYYADTGAPSDYASDVVLYQDGREVARKVIRVNDPLRYDGLAFYQSFFGPSVALSITNAAGATVFEEGVPLEWTTNDGARSVGTFVLPDANLTVWVVGSAGTDDPIIKPGQVRLEAYASDGDGTEPIAMQTLDQGTPATIEGLTVTFQRENAYTGLMVARDPGVPLVWLGSVMLLIGFVAVFMFPHRRIWARITTRRGGATVALAAVGRHDSSVEKEFVELSTDIRRALQAPTPTA
jgi:cytochrome c biogenesis protein